jgi:hypothetical protein
MRFAFVVIGLRAHLHRPPELAVEGRIDDQRAHRARHELRQQLRGRRRVLEIDVDHLLRNRRGHRDHARVHDDVGILERSARGDHDEHRGARHHVPFTPSVGKIG